MKQVVVLLEPDLHHAFKVATVETGESMQDVLRRAIEQYSSETMARLKKRKKES